MTWLSGRKRTPGKCVYVNSVSRVRIPPSPPNSENPISLITDVGFFYELMGVVLAEYVK